MLIDRHYRLVKALLKLKAGLTHIIDVVWLDIMKLNLPLEEIEIMGNFPDIAIRAFSSVWNLRNRTSGCFWRTLL